MESNTFTWSSVMTQFASDTMAVLSLANECCGSFCIEKSFTQLHNQLYKWCSLVSWLKVVRITSHVKWIKLIQNFLYMVLVASISILVRSLCSIRHSVPYSVTHRRRNRSMIQRFPNRILDFLTVRFPEKAWSLNKFQLPWSLSSVLFLLGCL